MPRQFVLVVFLFSLFVVSARGQSKTVHALKVKSAPKLDGKLDDPVWQGAEAATEFIIKNPDFGKPSAQRTEVKLIYTDEALYIGAHLYDDPKLVRTTLTSRDDYQFQDADYFGIAFDTYHDKQNAFEFIVTSANVQSDIRISSLVASSNGSNSFGQPGFDKNWDAVWDSRTSIANDGWIAEIKIPYSAIRFSKEEIQHWGLNYVRVIRRLNEESYWDPEDPKIDGYVNQFGTLEGLQGIEPPLRLSFLPYISTGYSEVPTNAGTIETFLHSGGMDVKYGINESLTLDMTLIPDFGQVQSDNVVLNLTPYEQQFQENRPFFTEGTELFNKAGVFYSRRVGSTPTKYYDVLDLAEDSGYSIIRNPYLTQLYNATKFSGRTKNNLGIGIFNAVTAPMHAELEKQDGTKFEIETEPLANYNIIVLDQPFNNRSSLTFTNTNVARSGDARDANVSALDLALFDKKNVYRFQSRNNFSFVKDADPHNGFQTINSLDKVSGKWQWGVKNTIISADYDPNDLGYLRAPNLFSNSGYLSFYQFTPNEHFNFRKYSISVEHSSYFDPMHYSMFEIRGSFLHVFRNFWDISLNAFSDPFPTDDFYELRTPGRYVKKPQFTFAGLFGSTDSRKKLWVNYGVGYAGLSPVPNDPFFLTNLGARYRFNSKFSLEFSGSRTEDRGNLGWADNDASTGEPFVGLRRILEVTTTMDGVYNFKARMNLSMRIRHYWSNVTYRSFYDVAADGSWIDKPFQEGYDENFNLFNLDMFFTWDFRLGSRLLVAWKNALGPDAGVDGDRYQNYPKNFRQSFHLPHSNELSVKFIYYIDYLQLKRKS
ncbi:MAG TPA: DUF5916 domain-containing protein [Parafilimonas sp.]|nr:DUF5916 domain-containing protein [Parafilimonas sp.]